MSSVERDDDRRAGELIERLLIDPAFRAEFRRDPAAACAAAGLPDLAAELAGSAGSMDTLVVRESRSSLAGVVMAVAIEGMSVAEAQALVQHGLTGAPRGGLKLPHAGGLKLPHAGGLKLPHAGGLKLSHGGALHAPLGHVHHAASPAGLQRELRSGLPDQALPAPASGAASSGAAGSSGAGAGGAGSSAAGSGVAGAAASGESSGSGGAAADQAVAARGASGDMGPQGRGAPLPWPDEASADAGGTPGAAGAVPGTPEPTPPNPGAQPVDGGAVPAWPDQQPAPGAGLGVPVGGGALAGADGTGGLMALLNSPRLSAPPNVRTFLASGGADPRMISVLDSALANHTIGLGQVVAVSDPVHAQAVDIVSVDGQPVGANNFAARDLVTEIAALDADLRPSEIGTPWPIRSQGFFSDPGAMDRLHLAFEMPGTDAPPAGAGVQEAGVMGSPVAGQVAYPAPAAGQIAEAGGQAAGGQVTTGDPAAMLPAAPLSSVVPAPIAASTPGSGVDAALAYAHAMIGKLPESAGSNLGPQLDKFEAEFGFHGAPWCGIFAGHVLEAAGLKPPHTVASVASILDLARNGDPPFLKGVLPVSEARPGDLVTFGGTEHVAVVVNVDSAGVHTIAGNTGQSNVSETTYAPSSVTGVVRPDYAAGKPGSIPGVWDYAGVQPPSGGAPASMPAAAPVAEAQQPAPAEPPANAPFTVLESHHRGRVRPTVQFLPAVQPSPGSPLYEQAVGQGTGQPPSPAEAPQQPPPAAAVDQTPAAPVDQALAAPAPAGAISVNSSLLTPGQAKFAGRLAELTGLDPRVVAAWELAEESGSAAQGREAASNFNWLNIGYFDSGAGKIAFDKTFSDPISAAEQSAKFLRGDWGGASSSIRAILNSVGHSPDEQMAAIANSDWASSHYGGGANLHGTYDELSDIRIEKSANA